MPSTTLPAAAAGSPAELHTAVNPKRGIRFKLLEGLGLKQRASSPEQKERAMLEAREQESFASYDPTNSTDVAVETLYEIGAQMRSRRHVLGGLAALPLASVPAVAASVPDAVLADLWHTFLLAQGAATATRIAFAEAEARLPWWANVGPSLMDHEGMPCGPHSSSPAIQDASLPEPNVKRVIRLGRQELEKRREFSLGLGLDAERIALNFDQQIAALEARIAAQQAERAKLRLDELGRRNDEAIEVMCLAEENLLALPDTSLGALAARIILTAVNDCYVCDSADTSTAVGIAAIALKGLLPHLSGELAADAAEIVDHPAREMQHMRASTGIDATEARVTA